MQKKKKRFLWLVLLAGCCLITLNTQIQSAKAQDERFVVLQDGTTVKDQETGLIWATQDNGADITWHEALAYCKNYSAGGHNDWRMPSPDELATLYEAGEKTKGEEDQFSVNLATKSIQVTAPWVWTSTRRPNNKAIIFGFNAGNTRMLFRGRGVSRRTLPVRSENSNETGRQK